MAALALCAAIIAVLAGCGGSDSNPAAPVTPTPEAYDSGTLAPTTQFVHFYGTTAGAYGHRCKIHSGMTGTVTVGAAGLDSAVVLITDNLFTPSTITVKPGAYVRWQNNGAMNHTVTRP